MKQLFITLFCFLLLSCNAQHKVTDTTYATVLEHLLEHNVSEVLVNEVSDSTRYVYIDAREKKEYEISHIKNALWVGYNSLDLTALQNIKKDTKIIVYCSVGYRSEKVTQKIEKLGYSNVSNLYGGIFEWVNQDKPVYSKFGITKKIHCYDENWGRWLNKGYKVY